MTDSQDHSTFQLPDYGQMMFRRRAYAQYKSDHSIVQINNNNLPALDTITTVRVVECDDCYVCYAFYLLKHNNVEFITINIAPVWSFRKSGQINNFEITVIDLLFEIRKPLKHLNINNVILKCSEYFHALSHVIEKNLVVELFISNIGLSGRIKALTSALITTNTLQSIDVSQNYFTSDDICALAGVFRDLRSLRIINMQSCCINSTHATMLLSAVAPKSTLESIDLSRNPFILTKPLVQVAMSCGLVWLNLSKFQIGPCAIYNFLMMMSTKLTYARFHRRSLYKYKSIGNHHDELTHFILGCKKLSEKSSELHLPNEILFMIIEEYLAEKIEWYSYSTQYFI